MKDTVEDLVVTGTLTVRSPDSKVSLTISAVKDGAGIWIGNDKTFVSIQNIAGQIGLVLAGRKDKSSHAFAVSIDENTGEPALQLSRPGKEVLILSGEALEKLFEEAK